ARTSQRIALRVDEALERERLIGLLRLDAELLSEAADDHINATDDEGREKADAAMSVILQEIREASDKFSEHLPRDEADMWKRLSTISQRLVRMVDATVKHSNRNEAELARKKLIEEVKPINFELDEIASALSRQLGESDKNAVVRELSSLHLRTTIVSSTVVALAAMLSLLVMWRVTGVLRRQQQTILEQVA